MIAVSSGTTFFFCCSAAVALCTRIRQARCENRYHPVLSSVEIELGGWVGFKSKEEMNKTE